VCACMSVFWGCWCYPFSYKAAVSHPLSWELLGGDVLSGVTGDIEEVRVHSRGCTGLRGLIWPWEAGS
jgi:hypothetical protein